MKTKTVGSQPPPKTPEEFYALGTQLDAEAKALDSNRPRGVFKFRTWEDHERWKTNELIVRARRIRAASQRS